MQRPITALLPFAIAGGLAVGGCASKADMDARYQASLQRWQGATRAELESAWGPPQLVQATPDAQVLTWTLRMDVDDREARGTTPNVTVTRAVGGNAAGTSVSAAPSGLAPVAVPITCTTHFVLKQGRVASWTFEGLGCGAPT